MTVLIEPVDANAVRPLRQEVLRPGLPEDTTRFRGDNHPMALHVGAFLVGDERSIVAVGTVFPDPPPWDPDLADAWRIRGMATSDGFRGQGLGGRVVDALIAHATEHDGGLIWCHARVGALDLYRRAGFVTIGEPFDDGVAMHHSMWRRLGPADET